MERRGWNHGPLSSPALPHQCEQRTGRCPTTRWHDGASPVAEVGLLLPPMPPEHELLVSGEMVAVQTSSTPSKPRVAQASSPSSVVDFLSMESTAKTAAEAVVGVDELAAADLLASTLGDLIVVSDYFASVPASEENSPHNMTETSNGREQLKVQTSAAAAGEVAEDGFLNSITIAMTRLTTV
jgi:hypothetical protein